MGSAQRGTDGGRHGGRRQAAGRIRKLLAANEKVDEGSRRAGGLGWAGRRVMVVASGAVAGCRGPTGTALLERQLFVLLCMRSLPWEMIVIFERCVVCDIFFFF